MSENPTTPASTSDPLVAAAGVCGALRATTDLFPSKVAKRVRHTIKQRAYGDFDPDNLMEHLPWLTAQTATRAFRDGAPLSAREAFTSAMTDLLKAGPQDVRQLPDTLSTQALDDLQAGLPARAAFEREWARVVRDLFETAGATWLERVAARTEISHPLVRIACVTRHPDMVTDHYTLLGYDPLRVDRKPDVAISVLVHPTEAEDMLDEEESRYVLLPSRGVSAERIATTIKMRGPQQKGIDTPLRSLPAALVAAAGVLGEPVHGHPVDPTEDETLTALRAMLPEPAPKPTRPGTARWPAFLAV